MSVLANLCVDGVPVGEYRSGEGLPVVLAPRPHLVLTTLSGTRVTDVQPDDHRWHLGVGVAVQDVGGANLWGGRTYVYDAGYQWLDDHGSMTHVHWNTHTPDTLDHTLDWRGPNRTPMLRERRVIRARPVEGGWRLHFAFTLRSPVPVRLGSPETNGRPGAAYGGFFWRLPRSTGPCTIFTPDARGEHAVHGTPAPWLAYHGDDGDPTHPFTVALRGADPVTAADRWFVRQEGYPGLGSSLAPATVDEDGPDRAFDALVLDGHAGLERISALWAAGAGGR